MRRRTFLWAGLPAVIVGGPDRELRAQDRPTWERDQLAKLAGRWTTDREEKAAGGTTRTLRVELVFTDGGLAVDMFDRTKGKRIPGGKLRVAGAEEIKSPGLGSVARLRVKGNDQQEAEVFCDFVEDRLVLVGRIGWRPWEGFSLSGEYQKAAKAE